MLRDITLGQYYPVDSVLHRLDPRTKLFGTLVYIISLFAAGGAAAYGLAAVFLAAAIRLSRVPVKFIVRGLKSILILLLISVSFNLFLTPGTPIFQIGFPHGKRKRIDSRIAHLIFIENPFRHLRHPAQNEGVDLPFIGVAQGVLVPGVGRLSCVLRIETCGDRILPRRKGLIPRDPVPVDRGILGERGQQKEGGRNRQKACRAAFDP